VAILVGGLGTRLRPVVSDRPKVLAPVAGRPWLAHLLDRLLASGAEEALLLAGYRAEQIQQTVGTSYRGMRLVYCVERSPLGTAGAVRQALGLIRTPTVLLLNGDSWCDVDLARFQHFHEQSLASPSLVLCRVEDTSRFGRVEVDEDGTIERFEEKGASPGPGWINAGVYLLPRESLASLPPARPLSLEREVLPGWVARRWLRGYRCPGRFLDMGTPDCYATAETFLGLDDPVGV
jgi:NDP-sugar pyrophosphorylase family protein